MLFWFVNDVFEIVCFLLKISALKQVPSIEQALVFVFRGTSFSGVATQVLAIKMEVLLNQRSEYRVMLYAFEGSARA